MGETRIVIEQRVERGAKRSWEWMADIDPDDPALIERLARAGYEAGWPGNGPDWEDAGRPMRGLCEVVARAVLAELRQIGEGDE